MTSNDFDRLVMDATEFASVDAYIAEVGGSVPVTVPDGKLIPMLEACWAYAHDRTVRTIRGLAKMSQAEFARRYRLPIRSVQNWECPSDAPNARSAPAYVLDLLAWAVINDIIAGDGE